MCSCILSACTYVHIIYMCIVSVVLNILYCIRTLHMIRAFHARDPACVGVGEWVGVGVGVLLECMYICSVCFADCNIDYP